MVLDAADENRSVRQLDTSVVLTCTSTCAARATVHRHVQSSRQQHTPLQVVHVTCNRVVHASAPAALATVVHCIMMVLPRVSYSRCYAEIPLISP